MADQREIAKKRNLEDIRLLLAHHNAADNNRATVTDEYLGLGRLRIQSGDTIDQWYAVINLCVFDDYIHEYGPIRCDLWCHLESQNRVHVLYGDRIVDGGLNGNHGALLDLR